MIKKKQKLSWREINFLYKKQIVFFWGLFIFFYNFSNNWKDKISVNIPTSLSKRSNVRNFIKRILYLNIKDNFLNKWYFKKKVKIFITLNKKNTDTIKKHIETKNKKNIKDIINSNFQSDLNKFIAKNENY